MSVALGVRVDGTKEILGLWLEQNEGAKFWLRVANELKTRGVEDILVAIIDGLGSFPEAIIAVFPQATVQTCIVHLLRHGQVCLLGPQGGRRGAEEHLPPPSTWPAAKLRWRRPVGPEIPCDWAKLASRLARVVPSTRSTRTCADWSKPPTQ